jgi:murein DD-endopeptidase MepM/ murein hydrolase activator NlpD
MLPRSRRRAAALVMALALALAAAPGPAAQQSPAPAASAPGAGAVPSAAPAASAVLAAPERARQGDLVVAWAACAEPQSDPRARLVAAGAGGAAAAPAKGTAPAKGAAVSVPGFDANELALAGAVWPRLYGFLVAVPTRLAPGSYRLEACGSSAAIEVEARSFVSETIALDAKNTAIRTAPDKKKDDEARRLLELLARADADALFIDDSPFARPLAEEARRSSLFGDRRVYAYSNGKSDTSEHAGYDFAVVQGTPVLASARGRVAMAADRIATGKTLVIEHLPGLYSIYMHLSSIEAAEGAIVEKGARIALSGSTGLSTGPHLHWELRANGAAVEPESLTAAPPLDKALIIHTIRALIEGR